MNGVRNPLGCNPYPSDDMRAILVHGMGRSPLSLLLLAKRLRSFGIGVDLFGYSTLRPFPVSLNRLVNRVLALDEPFILVGHSLGCVLIAPRCLASGDGHPPASSWHLRIESRGRLASSGEIV